MSEAKTLVKNGVLFSIAPFLPKVINIILLPIMTKYLTDMDFGISGTISAYTQAIGAFSTLGLGVVLMNAFYKSPKDYKVIWRQIYGFLILWMIVFALIQAVLLFFCIPEEAQDNKWWIILLTNFSTILFGPTATIGSGYFIYEKKAFPVVWRSILASIITIIVDFVLIVYLRWGYMGWYVGSFAGTFFSNASYWFVVIFKLDLRPTFKIEKGVIKHALSVGVPTIPHYYTSYLLEGSGRMVMDQYGISQGEIGRVSISQQIGDMFQTGMKGLNDAVQPYYMQSLKSGQEENMKNIGIAFTSLIFGLAFILAIWSKEIFGLLLSNESLQSAYPYFILYIMALCYRPLYYFASVYYFYYERTKQLLGITFASGIIAMLIYLAFTPKLGVWAFLVGHYVSCLYYGYSGYFFSCYKKNAKINFPVMLFLIIQIILSIAAFYLVEHIWAKVIITGIIITMLITIYITQQNLLNKFFKKSE